MNAGAAYSAGHNGDAAHTSEAPTYTDNSIEWDQTAPKVTVNQKVSQADPTTSSPVVFTVVFDETTLTTPAEFTASDISFTGSTAGGTLVATVDAAVDGRLQYLRSCRVGHDHVGLRQSRREGQRHC